MGPTDVELGARALPQPPAGSPGPKPMGSQRAVTSSHGPHSPELVVVVGGPPHTHAPSHPTQETGVRCCRLPASLRSSTLLLSTHLREKSPQLCFENEQFTAISKQFGSTRSGDPQVGLEGRPPLLQGEPAESYLCAVTVWVEMAGPAGSLRSLHWTGPHGDRGCPLHSSTEFPALEKHSIIPAEK